VTDDVGFGGEHGLSAEDFQVRRLYLAVGTTFLAFSVFFVLYAWWEIWHVHRREVNRVRLVWGQDAQVPAFNPLSLVNFSDMPVEAWASYVFALAFGASGFLALYLWRLRKPGAASGE
jgi:hypothetical protein